MISSLKLLNWKSHSNTQLEFQPGANVIIGPMGVGKSSILQAITFAMFGTFPEIKSHDIKTVELVTRGPTASSAYLELCLQQDKTYRIKRSIDKLKGVGDAFIFRDEERVAGPKPTEANDYLKNLLKIDEDTFLRTVYAQQNDIDLFLKLTPGERKRKIDELMNLDKFERARKGATKLANKIQVRQEESSKFISDLDAATISSDLSSLKNEIDTHQLEKISISTNVENNNNLLNNSRTELDLLRKKKLKVDLLNQRAELINREILELELKLKDSILEGNKTDLIKNLLAEKSKLDELKLNKLKIQKELDDNEAERSLLEKQVAVLDSKRGELTSTEEEIVLFSKKLESFPNNLEDNIILLKNSVVDATQKQLSCEARINNIIEHMSKLKEAESTCPVCDTVLSEENKQDLVSKRKREILELTKESNLSKSEVDRLNKELAEREKLSLDYKEIFNRRSELKKRAEALNLQLARITEIKKRKEDVFSILNNLREKLKFSEVEIEITQKKINELTEIKVLYDSKEKLDLLRINKNQVEIELSESSFNQELLTEAEKQYSALIKTSAELSTKVENLDLLIREKNKRLFDLSEKLQKISNIRTQIEKTKKNVDFLKRLNNALLQTQESLRSELISSVNELMNTIWTDLYPYEKWSGIKLSTTSSDYSLQLKDSFGEWLSVAGFASGGERMLAALAMRIAFAKILAPQVSLLILDEPTHNLDANAIKTFTEVIEHKLSNYLEQIFIITHDETLAEIGNSIHLGKIKE